MDAKERGANEVKQYSTITSRAVGVSYLIRKSKIGEKMMGARLAQLGILAQG